MGGREGGGWEGVGKKHLHLSYLSQKINLKGATLLGLLYKVNLRHRNDHHAGKKVSSGEFFKILFLT